MESKPVPAGREKRDSVWVLSSGSGEDGDQWELLGLFATREAAENARSREERATGFRCNEPEEWPVEDADQESR